MAVSRHLKEYCFEPEKIQNYELAINDEKHIWKCHHKLEAFFTMQELIDMGRYFNVPARELILVRTQKEHMNLPHCRLERKSSAKLISEKTKEAMAKIEKEFFSKNAQVSIVAAVKRKSVLYKEYKANGGAASWNEFQKGVR